MKKSQAAVLSLTSIAVAAVLFSAFAWDAVRPETKDEVFERALTGAIRFPIDPVQQLLPGVVLPLILLGFAAFLIAGHSLWPRLPKREEEAPAMEADEPVEPIEPYLGQYRSKDSSAELRQQRG